MDGSRLPPPLVEELSAVRSCATFTGCGLSAASGIRTHRPIAGPFEDPDVGSHVADALQTRTLREDADRTWDAVLDMARRAEHARPNRGHRALAALERDLDRFVLATQCVDGLHQRAGSRNVIELHGNLFDARCSRCGAEERLSPAQQPSPWRAPRCRMCAKVLRPGIVLGGELVPLSAFEPLLDELYLRPPDLLLIVGCPGEPPYIVEPLLFARHAGRLTVEITEEPSRLGDQVDYSLCGPVPDTLAELGAVLRVVLARVWTPAAGFGASHHLQAGDGRE